MAKLGPGQRYPTDLTDAEWALLEPLLPKRRGPGRPRRVDLRQVLNALFYTDAHRVPVAAAAARFPLLGDRAVLLRQVDGRWDVGAAERCLARAAPRSGWSASAAECGDP